MAGDASALVGHRLGPYQLIARLGAGAMGEVYRARDAKLGREVAIKILPRIFTSDPERLARFEREARALASLNHSNIATIYALEEQEGPDGKEGIRAIVMELVEGQTLAERLASRAAASGSREPGVGDSPTLGPIGAFEDAAAREQ